MDARFVYLPKPEHLPGLKSSFAATYSKTLKDLDRELKHLGAKLVTIQAGFPPEKIRLDGWPYSAARPDHPAVIVQFYKDGTLLAFQAKKFRTFEDNLRAIALTLEALRRVDRYGIVQGEQYAGFKRLGAAAPAAALDKDAALAFLRAHSLGATAIEDMYREAAKKLHPDRPGGSHEMFVKLQSAYELLKRDAAWKM